MAESDSAFGQIVGGKFQRDFVSRQNADTVAPEPAGQVRLLETLLVIL